MKKMSVLNAAQYFGVSKEAIHNRVRRGSLKSVVEDGVKLVIIDETAPQKKRISENKPLLEKIQILEDKIKNLENEKIEILANTQKTIQQIYREKDKQLSDIINSLELKGFVTDTKIKKEIGSNLILLKEYIKEQNLSDKKAQKIKHRFKKKAQTDERIIIIDKKYYLDLDKYDYRDLL